MEENENTLVCGWNRCLLRVDLSENTIQKIPLPEELLEKYLGGMGLADKIVWDYMLEKDIRAGFDPLSPDNILVIAMGPLTGLSTQGGRGIYQYISPVTGHLGGGSGGGFVHAMLKQAGYDALVITGKADHPVYLWIDDDSVDIKDASEMWGLGAHQTVSTLKKQHGEVCSVVIGPAGENLVRHATAMIDGFKSAGGKCGTGAVLGSKNLKAIIVRGKKGVNVADPKAFLENDVDFRNAIKENSAWPRFALWLAYFHTTPFKPRIAEHIYDYAVRLEACWNCHMACCGYHEQSRGKYRTRGTGPEIANQESFSALGVNDLEALNYYSDLFNDYGIDWKEGPGDIGIVMQLYKDGVLSAKDTDGLELDSGDGKIIEEMIHRMAKRERIGNLVAEGKMNIARLFPEARKYDNTVRGTTGYGKDDPRTDRRNIGPAVMCHFTPYRGACLETWGWQSIGLADFSWEFPGKEGLRTGRGYAREEADEIVKEVVGADDHAMFSKGEPKGWCKLNVRIGNWVVANESLILCRRIACIVDNNITRAGISARMLSTATGKEFTMESIERIGERIFNLQRMIDARLGITRKQDKFPEYFYQSLGDGVGGLTEEDEKIIRDEMDYYYFLRGWDLETGQPTKEKAEELGLAIEWTALQKDGPYQDWEGPPLADVSRGQRAAP
ncbi:MAG: aldehyde ferredoxin oxidoreductase N-terminal domain-containing protein [Solidesulfovibrio sp.]|uniref:aldehyde ferredoxin oxidoreductase N-terminal domain-containing protein n=1 Tax=Solidesulfovibrio sp. TaxID=2910990 RepID=UPI0031596589